MYTLVTITGIKIQTVSIFQKCPFGTFPVLPLPLALRSNRFGFLAPHAGCAPSGILHRWSHALRPVLCLTFWLNTYTCDIQTHCCISVPLSVLSFYSFSTMLGTIMESCIRLFFNTFFLPLDIYLGAKLLGHRAAQANLDLVCAALA